MTKPVRIKGYVEIIEALDEARTVAGHLSDFCVETLEENETLRPALARATAERDEARAALRRIEWACRDDFDEPYCSVCGAGLDEYPPKGHKPGCIVAAALREGEGK